MQIIQRVARLIAVSGFILVAGSSWASEKLILTGSSTVAPLALEIAKRFEKLNPGVRIDRKSVV